MWAEPVTLTGLHVGLEPLSHDHLDGMIEAEADGGLHRLWYTFVPNAEDMATEIDRRLALQAAGSMVPFTVRDRAGRIAGMTTYMNVDAANRRLEIGSTWYRASVQKSPLNTEAKRLLLAHAFETLDAVAVEFRTHRLNQQSRRAIERLGAQQDGILRNHMIMPDGSLRDTAVYSILDTEWPVVRNHLDWQMQKPRR